MGVFDNTARRAAKGNGVGFFQWTMPLLNPAVTFTDWLDARTAPPPPETELTCDALAEFATADHPECRGCLCPSSRPSQPRTTWNG